MRMIFPCFSVSVVMNDPKLAGECRGLANQKMLADPVLTRLRLHGIVPNAGRSGQVVPGGLLTLFLVISGTRSPASAGGRNRLAGNHRPLHRLERVVDPVIQANILEL
jgi:hypothetical protein